MMLKQAVEEYEQSFAVSMPRTKVAQPARLQIVRVYGDVSAGAGIWNDPDDKAKLFIEVNRIQIDEETYKVVKLDRDAENVIWLEQAFQYGVLPCHREQHGESEFQE